jgi:hypothetical protein
LAGSVNVAIYCVVPIVEAISRSGRQIASSLRSLR